ncbi:HIT domain-containing protein [Acidobacteriota bacterium]
MKECIFCHALKMESSKEAYILFKGVYNFIILNKFPYTPGHLMIAPYEHLDSFEKAEKESTDEFTDLIKMSLKLLRKQFHPHGFNSGMNIGQSAGAGVIHHYHLHIIPRWTGDSNFMPIVSKTKVVAEDLETTYAQLFPLFQKISKSGEI